MKNTIIILLFVFFVTTPAIAADGMVDVQSSFDVKTTADRLENVLANKGMTIFNRVNHAKSAQEVGIELRETELIIFGNPKVGSPLMQCQQTIAIDLPQKALIWEDSDSTVWLSYNEPEYLAKRHNLSGCDEILEKIGKALSGIANAAATQ